MTDKPLPVQPVTDPRALAARVRLQGLSGKPLQEAAWGGRHRDTPADTYEAPPLPAVFEPWKLRDAHRLEITWNDFKGGSALPLTRRQRLAAWWREVKWTIAERVARWADYDPDECGYRIDRKRR